MEDLSRINKHGLNHGWFKYCVEVENGLTDREAFTLAGYKNPSIQLCRLRKNTRLQAQVAAVRKDINTYRSSTTERELLADIREAHQKAIKDDNPAHQLAAIKLKLDFFKSQKQSTALAKKSSKKQPVVVNQYNIGDRLHRIKSGEKAKMDDVIDIESKKDNDLKFLIDSVEKKRSSGT